MTHWVLLRGLTREAGHWGGFTAQLQARLGDAHTVRAIDLPGNGSRRQEDSPARVEALAADCRAEVGRVCPAGPVKVVAMSLGAMVALEWARQAPQELAGCVLINTSVRGFSPFWQRLCPPAYPRLLGLLLPGRPALERERTVLHLTSADPSRHAGMSGQWAELARQRPVTARNALRQLAAAARYGAAPVAPAVPVMLLSSAGDRLVSPACSATLAARWQLVHRVHPTAGHDLPLDDPQWVLNQLLQWRTTS